MSPLLSSGYAARRRSVELIDDFTHPKTGKRSQCYRMNYRHMDRSLVNAEIDALQQEVSVHVVC